MKDIEQRRDHLGRLLADPVADDAQVAAFLQAFRGRIATRPSQTRREWHLDALRAAVSEQQAASRRLPLRERVRVVVTMTTAKVALAGAVAAAATGGAATGSLPAPVQEAVADVAGAVGIQLPHPGDVRPGVAKDAAPDRNGRPAEETEEAGRGDQTDQRPRSDQHGQPAAPPTGRDGPERPEEAERTSPRQGGPEEAGEPVPGGSDPGPPADGPAGRAPDVTPGPEGVPRQDGGAGREGAPRRDGTPASPAGNTGNGTPQSDQHAGNGAPGRMPSVAPMN